MEPQLAVLPASLKFNKQYIFPASCCHALSINHKKIQVGKDQEKVQSEKDSHSKNRGGRKPNQQSGTDTRKTFRKPNEQLISQ